MQNLAGLGVGRRVGFIGLICCQIEEHATRERRVDPERLQGRDQSIAAEDGAEPGNAGIGVGAFGQVRRQHVEIGDGAADHFVENIVGGLDRGLARERGAKIASCIAQRGKEQPPRRDIGRYVLAANFNENRGALAWLEVDLEDRAIGCELCGLWRETQLRIAPPVIEARIGHDDRICFQ